MSKIMVVEDDASLREIYGIRIAAEGYDIVSAGDGEEALAMAVREKPDLILADVMMPKISGFDMLDILRSTPETADIKVVMMTALSGDDQRERGERLGADKYLVKSQVGIEDMVNTIHEVLGDRPTTAPATTQSAPAPAPEPAPVAPVPAVEPTPAPAPEPAPAPMPEPAPAPIPETPPAPAPEPEHTPEPESAPAPEPAPEPMPEPESAPEPTSAPEAPAMPGSMPATEPAPLPIEDTQVPHDEPAQPTPAQ